MTDLTKPIARRTCRPATGIRRRLVVSLEPGDILGMRELGRRTTYRASLDKVFWMLVKWELADRRRAKKGRGAG